MVPVMALIGPTFPPWKMPPEEAELAPAARSVVARLHVISLVVWILCTVAGACTGIAYAIGEYDDPDKTNLSIWYKLALIVVIIGSGAVGCFIGYLTKVFIDWARQVLVLLGQIAKR